MPIIADDEITVASVAGAVAMFLPEILARHVVLFGNEGVARETDTQVSHSIATKST